VHRNARLPARVHLRRRPHVEQREAQRDQRARLFDLGDLFCVRPLKRLLHLGHVPGVGPLRDVGGLLGVAVAAFVIGVERGGAAAAVAGAMRRGGRLRSPPAGGRGGGARGARRAAAAGREGGRRGAPQRSEHRGGVGLGCAAAAMGREPRRCAPR
jgi:hypothetical protein